MIGKRIGLVGITLTVFVLLAAVVMTPLVGQNETIITLYAPNWMSDVFDAELFTDFYEQHPGVKVVLVNPPEELNFLSPAAYGGDEYYENVSQFTSQADVLYVSSGGHLSAESTRAGYYLDLAPLIEADPTFAVDDFYPAALQAYQWDRGQWALPVTGEVQMLIYDALAFDEAGLSYPTENWTLDDLLNAGRALTKYDEAGNVEVRGLQIFQPAALFASLYGISYADQSQLPPMPDFTHPDLAPALEAYSEYLSETQITGPFDFTEIPMSVSGLFRLMDSFNQEEGQDWQAVLLPGGRAVVNMQGFAVSGGTQHPELSYELTKYLTENAEVVFRFFGDSPARRSMVGVEPEDTNFFRPQAPEHVQELIRLGMENAIPESDLLFSDYINIAVNRMSNPETGVDAVTALSEAQEEALENLARAEEQRADPSFVVITPVPTPSIGQDEIVMQFGVLYFSNPLPNQELWDRLREEFIAETPGVGNIDLVSQASSAEDLRSWDCYYQNNNSVLDPNFDGEDFLNLDPFMDADPNFDPNDFLGNTLQQVQKDNRTWAYPLMMQPSFLWYDSGKFEDANLVSPEGGWSVEAFDESLQILSSLSESDDPVFVPETFGPTYLLMLFAAYGAIPYDTSTDPAIINLTDPATVEVIREVLDLARDGLLDYRELGMFGGGGFGGGNEPPIVTDTFSPFSFRFDNRENVEGGYYSRIRVTNYPHGSQYTPVAFTLGTAFINAGAQNPEACYQWISKLAEHPEIFAGMPVRQSQLNNPDIAVAQGDDVMAFYNTFAERLSDPNVVTFAGEFGGVVSSSPGAFLEPEWMYRAFNAYVLDGADLEAELSLAEENIQTYRDCTSEIPIVDFETFEGDQEASRDYFRQFIDCGVAITPELRDTFIFYYQDEEDEG